MMEIDSDSSSTEDTSDISHIQISNHKRKSSSSESKNNKKKPKKNQNNNSTKDNNNNNNNNNNSNNIDSEPILATVLPSEIIKADVLASISNKSRGPDIIPFWDNNITPYYSKQLWNKIDNNSEFIKHIHWFTVQEFKAELAESKNNTSTSSNEQKKGGFFKNSNKEPAINVRKFDYFLIKNKNRN